MQNDSATVIRRHPRAYRATSLVEVLVVLVILLIGVFAIIRVFPLGFVYLGTSENRMRANALVHNGAEQVKSDVANLPDAVCYSFFSQTAPGGPFQRSFIVDTDPDDLTGDVANPYYSDVNKFRFIKGEPVKIGLPTPNAFSAGGGFTYMLKMGPIYMDPTVGNPANAPTTLAEQAYYNLFLAVNSAPLTITEAGSGGGTFSPNFYRGFLRTPQDCVADLNEDGSGGAWVLVSPSSQPRIFTARYIKLDNDHDDNPFDGPGTLIEEQLTVAPNAFAWIKLQGTVATPFGPDDAVQQGSLVITREFTRLPSGANWHADDPYEYKLITQNLDAAAGGNSVANLGIVAFNPSGSRFSVSGSGSQDPFKAYIDYAVLDWHIIHDDRDVPTVNTGSNGEVPIRTTLTRLKSLDTVNPDNTFFEGIFPPIDTLQTSNTDIMIVRLDTGAILNAAQNGRPGDYELLKANQPAQQTLDYWANTEPRKGSYATGVFYINANNVPFGTPLRILYKAQGEWGTSLNKAFTLYRVSNTSPVWSLDPITGNFISPTLPDVCWTVTAGTSALLYFPRTELNKAVTAVFEVLVAGKWHRTPSVQISIDTPATWDMGGNPADVAAVEVTKYLRRVGWDGTANTWRVSGNLRGVSVKNRVIWKDGLERNSPWRIQDLDTYLTQGTLQ